MKRPPRIIPVFRSGKGHEQYPDGFIIHPGDRPVRRVRVRKPKASKDKKQEGKDGDVQSK